MSRNTIDDGDVKTSHRHIALHSYLENSKNIVKLSFKLEKSTRKKGDGWARSYKYYSTHGKEVYNKTLT